MIDDDMFISGYREDTKEIVRKRIKRIKELSQSLNNDEKNISVKLDNKRIHSEILKYRVYEAHFNLKELFRILKE